MKDGLVYLIRHGQAGSRQNYDELSELGRYQAERLGKYLASESIRFATVVTGSLQRQRDTAALALANLEGPPIREDPRWSEFDLDEVYRGIAPQLALEDAGFAETWEAQQREIERTHSAVHRQWTACDLAVFMAWCEGRITFDGESFDAFCTRIRAATEELRYLEKPAAVFTSATPISLVFGLAQGMSEVAAMRLTGPLWNCSWNVLELKGGEMRRISYNQAPHLEDHLLTKR